MATGHHTGHTTSGKQSESKRIEFVDNIPVYVGYSDAEMRAIWLDEAKRRRPTWDEAKQTASEQTGKRKHVSDNQPTNIIDLASKRKKRHSVDEADKELLKRAKHVPRLGRAYRSDTVYPERIVQLREVLGFSQEDFAEVVGVTLELVQAWEHGTISPTVEQLEHLAFVSGMVTAAWFCKPPVEGWPSWEETSLRFH